MSASAGQPRARQRTTDTKIPTCTHPQPDRFRFRDTTQPFRAARLKEELGEKGSALAQVRGELERQAGQLGATEAALARLFADARVEDGESWVALARAGMRVVVGAPAGR